MTLELESATVVFSSSQTQGSQGSQSETQVSGSQLHTTIVNIKNDTTNPNVECRCLRTHSNAVRCMVLAVMLSFQLT